MLIERYGMDPAIESTVCSDVANVHIPYAAKLLSGNTFAVRVQNFHLRENFRGSMLVDLHWQSTRP